MSFFCTKRILNEDLLDEIVDISIKSDKLIQSNSDMCNKIAKLENTINILYKTILEQQESINVLLEKSKCKCECKCELVREKVNNCYGIIEEIVDKIGNIKIKLIFV